MKGERVTAQDAAERVAANFPPLTPQQISTLRGLFGAARQRRKTA